MTGNDLIPADFTGADDQRLRDADMLAVISEGEVVEYGSYAELLKKRGEFYKLYKIQAEALKAVGIID